MLILCLSLLFGLAAIKRTIAVAAKLRHRVRVTNR